MCIIFLSMRQQTEQHQSGCGLLMRLQSTHLLGGEECCS